MSRRDPYQPADLLTLAASLTRAQVDKMAHALGWPDTAGYKATRGAVRWRRPYRNGWSGEADDPEWTAAEAAGLAKRHPPRAHLPYTGWSVTPIGKAAVMLRIRAVLEARRVA